MKVHLVDGTYELFRYHFALPSHVTADGREVAATRACVGTVLQMLEEGATHVGVATDHVIESFRNDLWPGYKTSAGMPPELLGQFPLLEEALAAAGFVVFAMVEYEADDAMASAAAIAADDESVDQVLICTPDKDLGQCVGGRSRRAARSAQGRGHRRRRCDREVRRAAASRSRTTSRSSATAPTASPGCRAGVRSRPSTVLARYEHLEAIPPAATDWDVNVRGGGKLAVTLQDEFELALLFRRIATIERDAPTITKVDELEWTGPTEELGALVEHIDGEGLLDRIEALAVERA